MSTGKVSFVRSGIIAAIVLFMLFAITLLGSNYWVRLTLIILGIGITLVYIGLAFAALRTAEGGRRTLQIVGLVASILFAIGIIASQLNLLGQASSSAVPYLLFAYLLLSTLIFIIDGIWGKNYWAAWRRYIIPSIIGVALLIGGIFAWVSLAS
ncbi:DUF2207 domain-containing protein [Chloroflexia bacterium SDU3-3]|nr:DUF2207 domain-containing protein [Chloroflexia bacterium SDU3-3]